MEPEQFQIEKAQLSSGLAPIAVQIAAFYSEIALVPLTL
jgi:hypothetical protein